MTSPTVQADRVERIRQALETQFQPSHLEVIDDSAHHVGHAGAAGGAGHFRVDISASAFTGRSRIECHRLIYAALAELMTGEIHALSIAARGL